MCTTIPILKLEMKKGYKLINQQTYYVEGLEGVICLCTAGEL